MKVFNSELYYSKLKTCALGRPCLHFDRIGSTIDIAHKEKPNTVVTAREQSCGRGQRNNKWESPEGCAMASLKIQCARSSLLGKRFGFVQHILALAIANTLEKTDLRRLGRHEVGLKWPNDIIYKSGFLKLGGVLVEATVHKEHLDAVLSFGLNVDNRKPTTCINAILERKEASITVESVIANVLNELERLIEDMTEEKFSLIKSDYESRCLQMNKVFDDGTRRILVKGVNDDGYLDGDEVK